MTEDEDFNDPFWDQIALDQSFLDHIDQLALMYYEERERRARSQEAAERQRREKLQKKKKKKKRKNRDNEPSSCA